jgi:hypothetical protein
VSKFSFFIIDCSSSAFKLCYRLDLTLLPSSLILESLTTFIKLTILHRFDTAIQRSLNFQYIIGEVVIFSV